MADLEQRRSAWIYLTKVNNKGMLIQPDKIKELQELDKEFQQFDKGFKHFDKDFKHFEKDFEHFDRDFKHFEKDFEHFDRDFKHFDEDFKHFDKEFKHFDKDFKQFDKEFGSSLQATSKKQATPRTFPVKPVGKAVPSSKTDKGKGRAIAVNPEPSNAGSVTSSTNTSKNAEAKCTTKPAGSAEAARAAEQMKYALMLQREQGRGGTKSKVTHAGPSTPAKKARRTGSAASIASSHTASTAPKTAALKPVAFSSAPNGSVKTPTVSGPKVEISFAPSAASSSATTSNAFAAAPSTQTWVMPAISSTARPGSTPVSQDGGGSKNGVDVASTISSASKPMTPAAPGSINSDHNAQVKQTPKVAPPHLKTSVPPAQLDATSAAHTTEAEVKTGEKVDNVSSSPLLSSIHSSDGSRQIMGTDIARVLTLEKQVLALIAENKARGQKIALLEEKVDLLNAGGPSIMAPFMATIKYPCGSTEQVQICGNMRINELLEHAIAKRSVDLGSASHLKLSYEGKVLGHLSYIGQVQPIESGLFEILRA